MKTKHTKGEWILEENEPDGSGFGYNILKPSGDQYLAKVNGIPTNEICIANAKLIAAAPDMLKALIKIADHITMTYAVSSDPKLLELFRIHQILLQVVQKAT